MFLEGSLRAGMESGSGPRGQSQDPQGSHGKPTPAPSEKELCQSNCLCEQKLATAPSIWLTL